jgi:ABC-2 type transport system permease protein
LHLPLTKRAGSQILGRAEAGAFSLYTTTVTTLASRRQNLFLKRLRSTAAADAHILSGLLVPATAIALVQVIAILVVLAAVAGGPTHVLLLVAAVLATVVMMLGLGWPRPD